MKFGTSYAYWGNEWQCDYEKVTEKVAKIGFDVLEVGADHLFKMSDDDILKLKTCSKENGIEYIINSGPPKEYDLASEDNTIRENAIEYFTSIFHKMKTLDSKRLVGAIYSYWPCDFVDIDKKGAWERSIDSLKKISKVLEDLNLYVSLEVLNRYETYILNDHIEGLEYINRINSPYIDILLDTFHMNIEEDDMFKAIIETGNRLGHLHVGENNRKLPGKNNSINWSSLGLTLKEIKYDKAIVMEPFELEGGSVGSDIKVWRDLSDGASKDEMNANIKNSLKFLKDNLEI